MKVLRYLWTDIKRVKNIRVTYSLITKSGETILEIDENFKPDRIIQGSYSEYSLEADREVEEIYKKKFAKRSKELLKKYQKKKLNETKHSILEGGDYIIKCSWIVYVKLNFLTFS